MKIVKNLKEKIIFLRSLLKDYFDLEIKHKLPAATEHEKQLIGKFRNEMSKASAKKAGPSWQGFSQRLKVYARFFDPRNFLNWQLIFGTMFMKELPEEYFAEFKASPQWASYWMSLLQEDRWGNPAPNTQLTGSSGNVLTHAFHLFRFQKQTKVDFSKLSLVVEFGGGYGSMCRLIRRLGFNGTYILYDLPEFLCLQKFYLEGLGLQTDYFSQNKTGMRNLLVSSQSDLEKAVSIYGVVDSLFVATWSISETPLDTRKQIFNMVKNFQYFLFGFQEKFDNVNNGEYFDRLAAENSGREWKKEILEKWSGCYLFGKKKS